MKKCGVSSAASTLSVLGCEMNNLQIRHLRRFCAKHGLDTQLIDSTLTYGEVKQYLKSLVADVSLESRLPEWTAAEEEYMKNHFLWHYVLCSREGSNRSTEVGEAEESEPRFSLRNMQHIEHSFSLRTVLHRNA